MFQLNLVVWSSVVNVSISDRINKWVYLYTCKLGSTLNITSQVQISHSEFYAFILNLTSKLVTWSTVMNVYDCALWAFLHYVYDEDEMKQQVYKSSRGYLSTWLHGAYIIWCGLLWRQYWCGITVDQEIYLHSNNDWLIDEYYFIDL